MGKQFRITKSQIKEEILKCGRDSSYFLKKYAKIVHPTKGEIPFQTYDYQDDLLKKFKTNRFNIILKARQLGISTIVSGHIAWFILFQKHKEVIVLATKQEKARNILRKVKMILNRLPPWLRIAKEKTDNKNMIELTNGSRVSAESTAGDAGRSDALALLVVDEAAHVLNMSDIWTSVYPTLSTGGNCIALSTPYGASGWFHQFCVDAKSHNNDFLLTTLLWNVHPDRDEEWFQKETKNMTKREIAQELLCGFNASGATVIDPDDIDRFEENVVDPIKELGLDRNYWVWEEYDETKRYLITCDVARGDGQDYSSVVVLELNSVQVVAEYKGKLERDLFVSFVKNVADDYANPMLVIENNNIGITVAQDLLEAGYPNLYFSKKGTHEYVDPIQAINDSSTIPGITTSIKTRPLMIAKLEEYIRNKALKTYSYRFVEEIKTFIWDNGKPQAQKGRNDDLVMAYAIACWVRDTALLKGEQEVKYKKQLLSSIIVSRKNLDTTLPEQHNYHMTGMRLEKEIEQQRNNRFKHGIPKIFIG